MKARHCDRMLFGKYAGSFIHDVPTDYLAWVIKQINLNPKHIFKGSKMIRKEFSRRINDDNAKVKF